MNIASKTSTSAAAFAGVAAAVGVAAALYLNLSTGDTVAKSDARQRPYGIGKEARHDNKLRKLNSPRRYNALYKKRMENLEAGLCVLRQKEHEIRKARQVLSKKGFSFSEKELQIAYDTFHKHCGICGISRGTSPPPRHFSIESKNDKGSEMVFSDDKGVFLDVNETSLSEFSRLLEIVHITDPSVQRSIFEAWDRKHVCFYHQFYIFLDEIICFVRNSVPKHFFSKIFFLNI